MKKHAIFAAAFGVSFAGACWATNVSVVDQKALAFSVGNIKVAKGTVVHFTNSDNTPHNILITGEDTSIDGGLQKPGEAYKIPFLKLGTFEASCAIHPKMNMKIEVK